MASVMKPDTGARPELESELDWATAYSRESFWLESQTLLRDAHPDHSLSESRVVGELLLLRESVRGDVVCLPDDLIIYARLCGGVLRDEGVGVSVGDHVAPPGGPVLQADFEQLSRELSPDHSDPVGWYHRFLWLHPFTDGNGRTARVDPG